MFKMINYKNMMNGNLKKNLSKEFEAFGFFISDHPINQYKEIFNQYKIIDYSNLLKMNEYKQFKYCLYSF